jgi:hypothetical protein
MISTRFKTRWLVMAISLAVLVACKKGGDKGGGDLDEADKFFLKSVQDDLAAVKAAVAKGESPGFKCAGASSYADKLKTKKNAEAEAAVKELTQVCGFDAPLAALEKATKAAEDARKAKPTDNPLSECYSADQSTSLDELKKAGHEGDDKVKALVARWNAACPPK